MTMKPEAGTTQVIQGPLNQLQTGLLCTRRRHQAPLTAVVLQTCPSRLWLATPSGFPEAKRQQICLLKHRWERRRELPRGHSLKATPRLPPDARRRHKPPWLLSLSLSPSLSHTQQWAWPAQVARPRAALNRERHQRTGSWQQVGPEHCSTDKDRPTVMASAARTPSDRLATRLEGRACMACGSTACRKRLRSDAAFASLGSARAGEGRARDEHTVRCNDQWIPSEAKCRITTLCGYGFHRGCSGPGCHICHHSIAPGLRRTQIIEQFCAAVPLNPRRIKKLTAPCSWRPLDLGVGLTLVCLWWFGSPARNPPNLPDPELRTAAPCASPNHYSNY